MPLNKLSLVAAGALCALAATPALASASSHGAWSRPTAW